MVLMNLWYIIITFQTKLDGWTLVFQLGKKCTEAATYQVTRVANIRSLFEQYTSLQKLEEGDYLRVFRKPKLMLNKEMHSELEPDENVSTYILPRLVCLYVKCICNFI